MAVHAARSPSLSEMAEAMNTLLEGMLDRALSLEEATRAFEVGYVEAALRRYGGSIQRAAAALQVHRNTLRAKLKRGLRLSA